MALRPTMAALVQEVRGLIGDLSTNPTQQFSDQVIQDKLDARREDIRYLLMLSAPTIVQNAANNNRPVVIWSDYYAGYQHWEGDVVLQGNTPGVGSWLVLNAAASDFITGHFQFSTNAFTTDVAPQQYPPVWITGKIYDVYATARDLLRMWIAALATTTFDFTAGGGNNFKLSQVISNMRDLIKDYDQQAWLRPIETYRDDLARTDDTGLVIQPELKRAPGV